MMTNGYLRWFLVFLVMAVSVQTSQSWWCSLLLSLLCWVVLGGYYTLYIAYHTLPRDIVWVTRSLLDHKYQLISRLSRVIRRFSKILFTNLKLKRKDENVVDLFLKTAARVPNKVTEGWCWCWWGCWVLHIAGYDDFLWWEIWRQNNHFPAVSGQITSDRSLFPVWGI